MKVWHGDEDVATYTSRGGKSCCRPSKMFDDYGSSYWNSDIVGPKWVEAHFKKTVSFHYIEVTAKDNQQHLFKNSFSNLCFAVDDHEPICTSEDYLPEPKQKFRMTFKRPVSGKDARLTVNNDSPYIADFKIYYCKSILTSELFR